MTTPPAEPDIAASLARIADALERLGERQPRLLPDWAAAWAFYWDAGGIRPVRQPAALQLGLLRGIDAQSAALLHNTRAFAEGHSANNALLWGARGAGKSALVKAVCRQVANERSVLKLVQTTPETLAQGPEALTEWRRSNQRIVLFLDDASLENEAWAARALKPLLDGGLDAAQNNVLVYATANRRHLTDRNPAENNAADLFWSDTAEERLALSDRFGLTLGFHPWDGEAYLDAVRSYAKAAGLTGPDLDEAARQWALRRGARSGRTAWQFMLDRAGRANKDLFALLGQDQAAGK